MDFVTFEIAQKLREKGFRESCIAHYHENKFAFNRINESDIDEDEIVSIHTIKYSYNKSKWQCIVDVPAISQVLKWLREKHDIHIGFDYSIGGYFFTVYDTKAFRIIVATTDSFETYEQASLCSIKYVLDELI